MKRETVSRSEDELLTDHSELVTSHLNEKAANDDLCETGLERDSSASYERRRKMWAEFNRGDWWIALGLYLILSSVAFVVL